MAIWRQHALSDGKPDLSWVPGGRRRVHSDPRELADFYGVPVSELLPGDAAPTPLVPAPKLVIDLERMSQLPKDKVGPLARYVATIQSQRGDYNGRVLSVRHEDLRSLAVIYDKSPADLTEELISWGVLDADARG